MKYHPTRLAWLTLAYRLGEGSTETMLQLWQTETELQRDTENAQLASRQRLLPLQSLVLPREVQKPLPITHK